MWDESYSLRSSFGFKDNVLFSPNTEHPEGSGYTLNGADVTIFRLMNNGARFFFFVSGDDTRYFTPVKSESFTTLQATTIGNEDDAIARRAVLRWNISSNWESVLALQYFYQNQVFNVATESGALNLGGGGTGEVREQPYVSAFGSRAIYEQFMGGGGVAVEPAVF